MRVVVAEDVFLLRNGLLRLLREYDFDVVDAVEDAPSLLSALVELRPDLAIVDIRLPPSYTDDGLQAVLEARRRISALPILLLSQYVEQLYAQELLADGVGAVGYLLKDRVTDADRFVEAARRVAAGDTVLDQEVIAKLIDRQRGGDPYSRLSPREREVLGLMAAGRSNSAIAQRLNVTEKAIGKHTTSIFAKLDLPPSDDDNRRVLAVLAYLNS